jgi:hypothetical protein
MARPQPHPQQDADEVIQNPAPWTDPLPRCHRSLVTWCAISVSALLSQ